jgi:hypothetical protein
MPSPFHRITVDFLVRGSSRVSWELASWFDDPDPWTFTLQAGSGAAEDSDWTTVGAPAVDITYLVDSAPRAVGLEQTTHYRVKLQTGLASYTSPPVRTNGLLPKASWLDAREILRKELLIARLKSGTFGWLYKRKRRGEPADSSDPRTGIVDPVLGTVMRRERDVALNTGYIGGYYKPVPTFCVIEPAGNSATRDPARGNTDPLAETQSARMPAMPAPSPCDVFVADGSDRRWTIEPVQVAASIRDVAVVLECRLTVAPPTDVIYDLPMPPSALAIAPPWPMP